MTVNPVAGPDPRHVGTVHHSVFARWSEWLAGTVLAVFAAGQTVVVIAYLVGGDDAISDNWIGWTGGVTLIAALLGSLVAFGFALYARMKKETWRAVWLGIAAFPLLVALVLISEFTFLE